MHFYTQNLHHHAHVTGASEASVSQARVAEASDATCTIQVGSLASHPPGETPLALLALSHGCDVANALCNRLPVCCVHEHMVGVLGPSAGSYGSK